MSEKQSFAFYIDESGSPKPNPKDNTSYFAVGGVLVKQDDESFIEEEIQDFKKRWQIDPKVALHGNEIRSRKKNFAWLGRETQEVQNNFMNDLTHTITALPITVHACVVSRQGYLNRYFKRYGQNTWEMMKSSVSILLERISKYVSYNNLQQGFHRLFLVELRSSLGRLCGKKGSLGIMVYSVYIYFRKSQAR